MFKMFLSSILHNNHILKKIKIGLMASAINKTMNITKVKIFIGPTVENQCMKDRNIIFLNCSFLTNCFQKSLLN